MIRSVQSKMARGAVWMMLFKFAERSLGLVSTLILVRLLVPADFGVMAMAFSFIIFVELLTAFGFDVALIQRQDATEEHYHSAWTCNVFLGAAISVVMLAGAWPIAIYYGQPELFWVVTVLALGPLVGGAENIGVVAFRKELEFRKEFLFQLSRKLAGFVVAVPLAFLMRDYWALVCGVLASRIAATLISYRVHPFRPHLSVRKAGDLIGFSRWLLLNNALTFLKERSSDFFIGRIHGPSTLGLYNVSYEFANLPTTELSAPINRALLPGFARLAGDPDTLAGAYLNAVRMLALFAIPAAAGMFAVAEYFVPVILGEKWLAATPILKVLTINGAIVFFHSSMSAVLIGAGCPGRVAAANGVYVLLMISGFFLVADEGSVAVAYAVLSASIMATPVFFLQTRRLVNVKLPALLAAAIRPIVSAGIMIIVLDSFLPDYSATQPFVESAARLVAAVMVGIMVYMLTVLAIWQILGRPGGAERMLVDKLRERFSG